MRQIVAYGIAGVITTLINIIAYWALTRLLAVNVTISTVIAWLVAFIFAFWSNRVWVFRSTGKILTEFTEFLSARITTGILDVVIMFVFADWLAFPDVWVKAVSNIIVIVLNYVLSKLFIFKEEKS